MVFDLGGWFFTGMGVGTFVLHFFPNVSVFGRFILSFAIAASFALVKFVFLAPLWGK